MGRVSLRRQACYPWLICASCTLLIFCGIGLCGNAMPVYFPFLAQQRGFSNAQISAITTLRCAGAFVSMGLVPCLSRRLPLRLLSLIACLTVAASLLLMSAAIRPLMLYLAAVGTGLAYGLGSMVLVSVLVRNWFRSREGFALSLCACGSGLANMVASPLVTLAVEKLGLNAAFRLEALAVTLLGGLMLAVIRDEPAALGLKPYSGREEPERKKRTPRRPPRFDMAPRHQRLMIGAMLATGPISIAAASFYTMHYADCGYSPMVIAAGLSLFGLVLTGSKLIYGWCNDRFGVYYCNWLFLGLSMLGNLLVGFSYLFPPGPVIFIGLGLCALGYPPMMIGISLWARDLCRPERYTETVALYQQLSMAGGMVASLLGGFSADLTGSYTCAYLICVLLLLFTACSVQYLYRRYARGEAPGLKDLVPRPHH